MSETVPYLNTPAASLVIPAGKLPHDQPLPVLRSVQTALPLGFENPFKYGRPAPPTPPVQFKAQALSDRGAEVGLCREATWLLGWLVLFSSSGRGRSRNARGQLVATERGLAERLGAVSRRHLVTLLDELEGAGQLRWETRGRRTRTDRLTVVEDDRFNAHGRGHGYVPIVADELEDWCRERKLKFPDRLVLLQTFKHAREADGHLFKTEAEAAKELGLSRGQAYRLCAPGGPTKGAIAKDDDGRVWNVIYGQMTYQGPSRARASAPFASQNVMVVPEEARASARPPARVRVTSRKVATSCPC